MKFKKNRHPFNVQSMEILNRLSFKIASNETITLATFPDNH